ncbi:MAG: hypothetical protein HYS12_18900 [Planctomycetes bacterium]|nr:hypothetical protein [Planctomycetota bacterium]
MNCHDFQDWLQADLDRGTRATGSPSPLSAALAGHLAACDTCQRLLTAAQSLRRGLSLLAPPAVPAELLDRVVGAVLTDRRHRQRQRFRLAGTLALAASGLVIALAGQLLPRPMTSPRSPDEAIVVKSVPPAEPSIRDTVAEAGSAVAGLTARTVDQAVDRTRVLLPTMDDSLLPPMELPPPLETPSLAEAGHGVSVGLEPIADSARRAFSLFRRDLPPLGPDKKPEL